MLGSQQGHSFVTYTCHFVDPQNFALKSFLLNTEHSPESHTADKLSEDMKAIIQKWELKNPVIVTDNAKNVTNSCEKAELPHIGCGAHTLNLAVNPGLEVGEVSALVGKCKKLVAVFKMSALK